MTDFVFGFPLGGASGGVTTTDDRDGALRCCLHYVVHEALGSFGEVFELKNAGWSIPDDDLGTFDGIWNS